MEKNNLVINLWHMFGLLWCKIWVDQNLRSWNSWRYKHKANDLLFEFFFYWFMILFNEHKCPLFSILKYNCSTCTLIPNCNSLFNLQFYVLNIMLVMMHKIDNLCLFFLAKITHISSTFIATNLVGEEKSCAWFVTHVCSLVM